MRGTRDAMVRVRLSEQLIRLLLCRRLKGARGNLYTIRARQICEEISGVDQPSVACKVAVRRFVLAMLYEAIMHELSDKYRIVVNVAKAWELLACVEYEN
jgi:hypothetical protein